MSEQNTSLRLLVLDKNNVGEPKERGSNDQTGHNHHRAVQTTVGRGPPVDVVVRRLRISNEK